MKLTIIVTNREASCVPSRLFAIQVFSVHSADWRGSVTLDLGKCIKVSFYNCFKNYQTEYRNTKLFCVLCFCVYVRWRRKDLYLVLTHLTHEHEQEREVNTPRSFWNMKTDTGHLKVSNPKNQNKGRARYF